MENFTQGLFLILSVITLIAAVIYWKLPNSEESAKIRMEQQIIIRQKEAKLKDIYASMAKFDKLIAERDAAYTAGDMELYYTKVKEASKCYEEGTKLCKD